MARAESLARSGIQRVRAGEHFGFDLVEHHEVERRKQFGGHGAWLGPRLSTTRAPRALARTTTAQFDSSGTSICRTSTVSGLSQSSGSASGGRSVLAPLATVIWFSPTLSTITAAQPVGSALSVIAWMPTPASSSAASAIGAKPSGPTRPTICTEDAGSVAAFAAATA